MLTYVSSSTDVAQVDFTSAADQSVTLNQPTGATAGDLLVFTMCAHITGSNLDRLTIGTLPSGWHNPGTNIGPRYGATSNHQGQVFAYKPVYASDPANYTFGIHVPANAYGPLYVIACYRGGNPPSQIQETSNGAVVHTDSSLTDTVGVGTFTSLGPDLCVFCASTLFDHALTASTPSGMTVDVTVSRNRGNVSNTMFFASRNIAPGAYNAESTLWSRSVSDAGTNDLWAASDRLVEISPASLGGEAWAFI